MKKLSKNQKGLLAAALIVGLFAFWVWFPNWHEQATQRQHNILGLTLFFLILAAFGFGLWKNRRKKK